MKLKGIVNLGFLILLVLNNANAEVLQFQRVTDGDTFRFTGENCRLYGIDTPESKINNRLIKKLKNCKNISEKEMLATGKMASRYAKRQFAGAAHYQVFVHSKGRYGRSICSVRQSNGLDYSLEAVKNGYAVPYFYYLKPNEKITYKMAMYEAKLGKKGIWKEHPEVMECLLK